MTSLDNTSAGGFSLVEVSLALLVIGLGMLAVFGLFPSGLSMNKGSIDETQSSIFANDILDAYRGAFSADPNLLKLMGPPYGNDIGVGPTAASAWRDYGAAVTIEVVQADADFKKVLYMNWAGVTQNVWRYRLTFASVTGRAGRVKYARMQVISGEYGSSNNMVEFYTEYYNFRNPRYP